MINYSISCPSKPDMRTFNFKTRGGVLCLLGDTFNMTGSMSEYVLNEASIDFMRGLQDGLKDVTYTNLLSDVTIRIWLEPTCD